MSVASKIYRGIGVTLAVLASLGLIISSIPLSIFTPDLTPPSEISTPDSPSEKFNFEVVNTPETREKGLSGRTEIPPNYGMLFVFDEPGDYGFWMNDMHVAIDIIWIDEAGTFISVSENIQPSSYPESFYPPSPVMYVLETRPGEYKRQGWNIGEQIPLP